MGVRAGHTCQPSAVNIYRQSESPSIEHPSLRLSVLTPHQSNFPASFDLLVSQLTLVRIGRNRGRVCARKDFSTHEPVYVRLRNFEALNRIGCDRSTVVELDLH
jgi:hypothetical protein